eukprot:867775_1
MDRPLLYRQKTQEVLAAKQVVFGCVLQLIFLAPAIAAVVIAFDYDEKSSPCGNPNDYTINLQYFLWIGGGTQILYGVYYIAAVVIAFDYDEKSSPCGNPNDYTINLQYFLWIGGGTQILYGVYYIAVRCVGRATGTSDSCEGLWLLIWAIIGLVMWDNQFSVACQGEPIAQMILAW